MPSESILDKIHRQRVIDIRHDEAVPGRSFDDLQTLYSLGLAPPVVDVVERLTRDSATCASHIAVLAEIKRASPSKGDIDIGAVAAQQALAYAHGGASVISVLTEPKWFKGTLDDLREVRAALDRVYAPSCGTERPAVLRKDFIVDRYQILEARLAGADTVLLIVAILTDPELVELIGYTRSLGMEPLVEVNSVAEMERAVRASSRLVGINNRNLNTFHVDMDTTSVVAGSLKSVGAGVGVDADADADGGSGSGSGPVVIALSGISKPEDAQQYAGKNVRGVLVGEGLMRAADKSAFIRGIKGGAL